MIGPNGEWNWIRGYAGDDEIDVGDGGGNAFPGDGADRILANYGVWFQVRYDEQDYAVGPIIVDTNAGTIQDPWGETDTIVLASELFSIEYVGIHGTAFADSFSGETGYYRPLGGNDTIDGGGGEVNVDYRFDSENGGTMGVTVDLVEGYAIDGFGDRDTLRGVTQVQGSEFADNFKGSSSVGEWFRPLAGNDTVDGGGGGGGDGVNFVNAADYGGTAGVIGDLSLNQAIDGYGDTDTLINIQHLRGTVFADTLRGSADANFLYGDAGRDNIEGAGGDDRLVGGGGGDTIDGGEGYDQSVFAGNRSGYTITGDSGRATVSGADGTDLLTNVEVLSFDDGLLTLNTPVSAGITVSPTSGLITTEVGGSASFTIVLDRPPTAEVTMGVRSSDTGEGTVAPSSLTFDASSWDTPQTVLVTGVDDNLEDGNQAYTVVVDAAVSNDPDYDGLDPEDVGVTNSDDDTSGGGDDPSDDAPSNATLGAGNNNVNVDGVSNFTDFGGVDTYTVLPSLAQSVTITDNSGAVINLPEGITLASVSFLSNGMQFSVNGNVVTLLGQPQSFTYVFAGTPLDPGAGVARSFAETAEAFGTSVPASGEAASTGKDGSIQEDGSVVDLALSSALESVVARVVVIDDDSIAETGSSIQEQDMPEILPIETLSLVGIGPGYFGGEDAFG